MNPLHLALGLIATLGAGAIIVDALNKKKGAEADDASETKSAPKPSLTRIKLTPTRLSQLVPHAAPKRDRAPVGVSPPSLGRRGVSRAFG